MKQITFDSSLGIQFDVELTDKEIEIIKYLVNNNDCPTYADLMELNLAIADKVNDTLMSAVARVYPDFDWANEDVDINFPDL